MNTDYKKIHKYIYTFNYETTQSELCKLESNILFGEEENNKQLFSDVKVEPTTSAFIKRRLDVNCYSDDYKTLIQKIKAEDIHMEGFKIEYFVLEGDETEYKDRLSKLRDIGYSIHGYPDYYNPKIMYGLCFSEGVWYFGEMAKDEFEWHEHNNKPCSFSHSISMVVAKSLVCLASKGDTTKTLIDTCCGVGTIMLEACYVGNPIDGCDINWKAFRNTKENLAHYGYFANVYLSDIGEIDQQYDAGIIDLPYNLYSSATDEDIQHIIQSAAKLTNRLIIVSTANISEFIHQANFEVLDSCHVTKKGRSNFARKVWICKKK